MHRIEELRAISGRVAYMCAEAVYWRCHRRLVSDYLTYVGVEVMHIDVATGKLSAHAPTEPSYWGGVNVVYSACGRLHVDLLPSPGEARQ
ncbi:MAG: DUF488 family protein [Rhizobiaceae bacterium]|nr:MAG: DUF488 family protein [Rhizobiaceae bacterium]